MSESANRSVESLQSDTDAGGMSHNDPKSDIDPLASVRELAERWDTIADRLAGRGDWKGAEVREWCADELRAALAAADEQVAARRKELLDERKNAERERDRAERRAAEHPHDDKCESEYETGAHAWTPCGCWASRTEVATLVAERDEACAEIEAERELSDAERVATDTWKMRAKEFEHDRDKRAAKAKMLEERIAELEQTEVRAEVERHRANYNRAMQRAHDAEGEANRLNDLLLLATVRLDEQRRMTKKAETLASVARYQTAEQIADRIEALLGREGVPPIPTKTAARIAREYGKEDDDDTE